MSQKKLKASDLQEDNYTLVDHLTELRKRIVYSLYAVIFFTVIAWIYIEKIFDYIRAPAKDYLPDGGLVFMGYPDKFMAYLKVAIICGIVAACPVWIYQVWRFVAPGLYAKEKKYGRYFIFFGSILFLTGVSFAYFVVLPAAIKVLMTFGGTTDKPMITVTEHVSFFTVTILVFGAAFEMPLIFSILGLMGIVSSRGLRHVRRYAIVAIAVVAAIFTPPDAMSMMLLGIPLWILYEISILVLSFVEPKV